MCAKLELVFSVQCSVFRSRRKAPAYNITGPRKVLRSKLFGERRNKWSKLKRFTRKPFSLEEFVWTRQRVAKNCKLKTENCKFLFSNAKQEFTIARRSLATATLLSSLKNGAQAPFFNVSRTVFSFLILSKECVF